MDRRTFISTGVSGVASFSLLGLSGCLTRDAAAHPWMYIGEQGGNGRRSLDALRSQLATGHTKVLWDKIISRARRELDEPVWTPATPLPNRPASAIRDRNASYVICYETGQRVLRHAIASLLTGEDEHRDAALRQIHSLFDENDWPLWIDNAHLQFGLPAGLRTGMLARDVGLAFDWLYPSIEEVDRRRIVDGLGERAFEPLLKCIELEAWFLNDMNNWLTTIVGGIGIAAMAVGDEHPSTDAIIDYAVPSMTDYFEIYGSQGEFNESVAYANATERPVAFFSALRSLPGRNNELVGADILVDAARWIQYLTLPPGRIAAMGDGHADAKPWVRHLAAVAAATRDGLTQSFYLANAGTESDVQELLWYDPTVVPVDPQGNLPLGRAFPAQGGCVSSRTSWDQLSTHCVVYGKASREENHEHHDDGQVNIDGFGERLIIDIGSPSGYPADFFEQERWEYYNASISGHNIVQVGGRNLRTLVRERGDAIDESIKEYHGRFSGYEFDDERGGWWKVDSTNAYEGVKRVQRTVVHAHPGIVVVVDDVEANEAEPVALRWHTIDKASPSATGDFVVKSGEGQCIGRVIRADGPVDVERGEHRYNAPFDRDRSGDLLEQRFESYVEASCVDRSVRFVTLFLVERAGVVYGNWADAGSSGWTIESSVGTVRVSVGESIGIFVDGRSIWEVGVV